MFFTIYFLIASSLGEIDLNQVNSHNLFKEGKEEVYSIRYRWLMQDIAVGTLKTRFNGKFAMNGNTIWNFYAEAKSNEMANNLKQPFCVTMESWVDQSFKSLRFNKTEDWHGRKKKIQICIDQFNNRGSWDVSYSKDKNDFFTGEILPSSRDLLALLYLLKAIPAESLGVGKSWSINMVRENKSKTDSLYSDSLQAMISAIEIITIQGRETKCFVFEIEYRENNFLGSTEKIKIWLNRRHRIMMLQRGNFTLVLKK
ncbi:MAG: DUF3108 domain-containing protein [Patescibacteria group bacterium]|nr:DUF3108 domain-containing protein [Patescibacteria group bacterium]MDD5164523.1 DUF3108 domain-containing protein [Patescibacteria group bacterium]MDD5534735.1 DUF3108 domain-containing protein [Patescibacteria group bacterium]